MKDIKLRAHLDLADYGEALLPGERSPAAYAANKVASRGRLHSEPECLTRSPFQRDRDRILHSTGFRRLTYKTQVFLFHEGDHYRSRLTHSLEVSAVARGIAVPGMPMGSPGMEQGGQKDAYDIVLFDKAGKTRVYASR